ncbi:MAG: methyl-accepting chemotaxis protein [Woeseiaceae bacterium]|nr:methyl-accepting chemotaxis protein [Woeseiaceae bacterium]
MANSADTATTFRIVAIVTAILLLAAAALTFFAGQGSSGSAAEWAQLQSESSDVLSGDAAFTRAEEAAGTIVASADAILGLSNDLLDRSGATDTVLELQRRAARISSFAPGLASNPDVGSAIAEVSADAAYLRMVVDAFAGEETELDISALDDEGREAVLVPLEGHVGALEAAIEQINADAAALAGLAESRSQLASTAARLASAQESAPSPLPDYLQNAYIPLGLIGIAILMVVVLVSLNAKSSHFESTAKVQAEQNERNQQAILRLLDEMGSLADGDLTVEATVTEDITGTIADSFNFAIEELRKLVTTVNETAIMVDCAAKQTESTAAHMAKAADNQGREINAATESIVSMAASIEEVSGNAERSSDVARHSVEVAHKGGEAVRRTIDGMNTIRETIQDTSKRIKRLGESSQEIGNIVELINDIAEQTNILALNASIQASMAGEAGRGFAVVADEVQRLAERSTNATKQIEVLVRTIQADTNEAVVSMERSTTDVVGGALLAENAGAALDEIEQVSNQIASLVQNISSSARQQAGSAADVTRRTTRLREISEQTGKATTATAASIAKLSELASQLRETVSGFTLPENVMQAKPLAMSAANAPVGEPPAGDAGQQVKAG